MWDQRYAEAGFAYGTEPNDFLAAEAGRIRPGGRVLCLAEGEGRNAVYLAGLGLQVHAVDLSSVGLAKAAALARQRGVSLVTEVADLAAWEPGTACWDAVVSIWAHLPPGPRAALHRRVVHALAPGGLLLLEAYTPDQLRLDTGGPRVAEMMMTPETLRAELEGLVFERLETLEREVHEGRYHEGRSAVVQAVARRP